LGKSAARLSVAVSIIDHYVSSDISQYTKFTKENQKAERFWPRAHLSFWPSPFAGAPQA
jgi:hypothetical protein